MKKTFISTIIAFVYISLIAQTDVTESYLTNAGFDINCNYVAANSSETSIPTTNNSASNSNEISGWTRPVLEEWLAAASFEYGFAGTFNTVTVPSVAPDGVNAGSGYGCLGMSVGWGLELAYTQEVTLPAGAYTLIYDVYNSYTSSQTGSSIVGWIPNAGSSALSSLTSFPSSVWIKDSVNFTLDSETSGKIQVGLKPGGSSSSGLPRVFFDGVKLYSSTLDGVATLSSLTADIGTLSPALADGVYDYTLVVEPGTNNVNLTATSAGSGASVEGAGSVTLDNGEATQTITVTSANGQKTQDYTINIVTNYITAWDGGSATGSGSEPNNFGWSCSPATSGWAAANVFGIRFQDNVSLNYNGGSKVGRILYVRWDGTGGVTTASSYNYVLELESCTTYELNAQIAWHSNGSAPTFTFNVNSEKDNSGINLIEQEVLSSTAKELKDAKLVFNSKEAGTYYLNIGSSSAVLAAVAELGMTRYNGDAFISSSVQEMSLDSTSLSQSFDVSAYGITEDITFVTPQGMIVTPSVISPAEAQCGLTVTATFDNPSDLADGELQILSGELSSTIIIKEILPPYMVPGTYELSDDGTWCWFQDPRAVYYEGEKKQTYTGWITSKGKVQVASFNHETGEVLVNTVSPDDFMQIDDHNNPTFLIREDGRILVSYSGHFYGPMRVIVSTNPEDITSFGPEANFGNNVTYANPYQIGETTAMFYRDGSTWHPTLNTSTDGGLTWGTPRELITRNGNQQRPYAKYTQDKSGGIHIIFTTGHPRQEANNHVYYIYFKDNKFYKADGTYVKDLITDGALNIDNGEAETIYDASAGKGWTWDITLDADENPVVLYAAFPDDLNHHYYYAYWDGTSWVSKHIVNSGRWFPQTPEGGKEAEPNYSGGMVLDPNDPSTIYLSKQVNGVFEIYKYSTNDKGNTWDTEAITENTPEGTINVRPVIPRGHKDGSFNVVWMRGTYITYANYLTSVMYYSPNSLDANLDTLKVNGVPISDFNKDKLSYNISLISSSLDGLVVEGIATASTSHVKVVYPDELPGTVQIIVASDGSVKTKTYTLNISLKTTALDNKLASVVSFSPNPVKDILTIHTEAFESLTSISFYNLQGKEIKTVKTLTPEVSVIDLPSGYYIIKLEQTCGASIDRIVKI